MAEMNEKKMVCPNCQKMYAEGAKFCPDCGVALQEVQQEQPKNNFCPNCGTELNESDKICSNCGAAAFNVQNEQSSAKIEKESKTELSGQIDLLKKIFIDFMSVLDDYSKSGLKGKQKKDKQHLCIDDVLFTGFVGPLGNKNTRGNNPFPPYSEEIPKNYQVGDWVFSKSLLITEIILLILDVLILKSVFQGMPIIIVLLLLLIPGFFTYIYLLYARNNKTFVDVVKTKEKYMGTLTELDLLNEINYIPYNTFQNIVSNEQQYEDFKALVNMLHEESADNEAYQLEMHIKTSAESRELNQKEINNFVRALNETGTSRKSTFDSKEYAKQLKIASAQNKTKSAAHNLAVARESSSKNAKYRAANAERQLNEAKAELLAAQTGNTYALNKAKSAAHNLSVAKASSSKNAKYHAANAERQLNEAIADLLSGK